MVTVWFVEDNDKKENWAVSSEAEEADGSTATDDVIS